MEMAKILKIHRRSKAKKTAWLFASFIFMVFSAYFISLSAHGSVSFGKIVKQMTGRLVNTFHIKMVESSSPVMEYGLYSQIGLKSFPNWEVALITGGVSKNTDMQKLVAATKAAKENATAVEASLAEEELVIDKSGDTESETGDVEVIEDDTYYEPDDEKSEDAVVETSAENVKALTQNKTILAKLKRTLNLSYLIQNFYIVDSGTKIDKTVFNVDKLLKKDCTISQNAKKAQILIYHTHGGSEAFADSKAGEIEDSVVGVGTTLADILTEKYGYNVIHDKTCYDVINGSIDRSKAYDKALTGVSKILKENPSVEVLIDLHRDQGKKRVTTINGKQTAQVMLFNGLSRNNKGKITYLNNPNLQSNLAFSLRLKMKAMELYPNLTTKIYLKQYRYNLHLRKKSILIELGTNQNTIEEAKNAMTPLANVLNEVLNED